MDALLDSIKQVAFVVQDVRKAADIFANGFGLELLNVRFGHVDGDPDFVENTIDIDRVSLDGEPIGTYGIEMAACDIGSGVQIEIIQPAANRSLFREYLDQYGCSMQHIAIESNREFHETIGYMAAAGNPLGQFARVDGDQEECAFIKHRYSLGFDIELHNRLADFRLPQIRPNFIKPDPTDAPRPALTSVSGINIVTDHLDDTVTLLRDQYGLTDWEFEDAHMLKHAYCKALNVEIQVLEPLDISSGAAQWMKKHGRIGVCSVEFDCSATEEGLSDALRHMGRTPHKMFANKISADFEDILGVGLVFRVNA